MLLTVLTMVLAPIPYWSNKTSPGPLRGISLTANVSTITPFSFATTAITASPRPPKQKIKKVWVLKWKLMSTAFLWYCLLCWARWLYLLSLDKLVRWNNSNESYWAVVSCGWPMTSSGGSRGGAREAWAPLLLRPNWGPKDWKFFLETTPPPPNLSV